MYNWQAPGWPKFVYNEINAVDTLTDIAVRIGRIKGIIETLPAHNSIEAEIDQLSLEAIQTSAIEGEYLNRIDVASSIRKNLGLIPPQQNIRDQRALGIGEMMVLVRDQWNEKLTDKMLHQWHSALMKGHKYITAGQWRAGTQPMQIISGSIGKEIIHFEAPPSSHMKEEMSQFISWYNETGPQGTQPISSAPIRAAIVHLYFESIHPYEDGNGRIGRALADKALYETIGYRGLPSISNHIVSNLSTYYDHLKAAQRSLDITQWILYFIDTIAESLKSSEKQILFTLHKTKLFDRLKDLLNARQEKVLNKMLDEGPRGYEGGMTAQKYMRITKTSKPTATRDLQDLLKKEAIVKTGGGRSISYQVMIRKNSN